ncbi:MAG TPA: cupin domain-containing protein [bacterium]|nr:cupin domain-containing protein [bacterium]HRU33103.1 cupin domain-containing protein [bacterium]
MERAKESEKTFRYGEWGPKYIMRGPRIEWGLLRLIPGKELGAHYHREVEETFYVISGKAQMTVDGETFEISAGDAIRVEAPEEHNIIPSEDFLAIFIKAPYLPEDKYTK